MKRKQIDYYLLRVKGKYDIGNYETISKLP